MTLWILLATLCAPIAFAEHAVTRANESPVPLAVWQPEGMDSVEARVKYLSAKLTSAKPSGAILDELTKDGTQTLLIGESHNENEDYYPRLFKYLRDRYESVCLLMEYPDAFNRHLHRYLTGEIDKKKFDAELDLHGYSPVSAEVLSAAKDLNMKVDFVDTYTRNKVSTARFRIRNEHMADAIDKKRAECRFSVAILGACHLVDEAGFTGVDQLLRQRGVPVKSARVLRVRIEKMELDPARIPEGFTKTPFHLPWAADGRYQLGDFPKEFEVPPNYGSAHNWLAQPPVADVGFFTALGETGTVPAASSVIDTSTEELRRRSFRWDTYDAVLVIPKH